ncbi:MAG: diaminopimelate epimerase [Candidatus Desulfofervidaceae bacterium]|nr:diaminopimelate epimerase [Candidatus Desulfofervidaceae bacterium]MDL1970335.1 diaminopimelate epimerase [Candidatus Desulfofervidaceae bacterium]
MFRITFYKMTGSGNDFILIDNRKRQLKDYDFAELALRLCNRKWGVGADGLIILEDSDKTDFKWHFFNADGSEAEMCGNGGRCAARLAYILGMGGDKLSFETKAGVIHAEIDKNRVKLAMTPPQDLCLHLSLPLESEVISAHFINTGVPHTVLLVEDLENAPVVSLGRQIRFHEYFQPAGTNVNFVRVISPNAIQIRTYERGVEDETLACGTGSVASALIAFKLELVKPPVKVGTKSGEILEVFFTPDFSEVFLKGEARLICQGEIYEEVLK